MKCIFPPGGRLFILVASHVGWAAKIAARLIESLVKRPDAPEAQVRKALRNAAELATLAERADQRYRALASTHPGTRGAKLMRLSDDMASIARRMNALSVNA